MIYEYLIDPEFLGELAQLPFKHSFFLKQEWGPGTHRFCLRLMEKWDRIPEKQSLSLKQKVLYEYYVEAVVKRAKIARNMEHYDWDGKKEWKENIEAIATSGKFFPIRMVFTNSVLPMNGVFGVSSLQLMDDNEEAILKLWNSDNSEKKRTAKEIAGILGLFLCASENIIWIDPYFQDQSRFINVLTGVLAVLSEYSSRYRSRRTITIVAKYSIRGPKPRDLSSLKAILEGLFAETRLPGTIVKVVFAEDGSKYKFHDRYMISELGGILFPGGTDECPDRDVWDLYLMPEEKLNRKRDYYSHIVTERNWGGEFLRQKEVLVFSM